MVVDTGSSKVFLTFPMSLFPDCISPDGITVGREEAVDAILRDRKLSYNKHTYQSPNLRVTVCDSISRCTLTKSNLCAFCYVRQW